MSGVDKDVKAVKENGCAKDTRQWHLFYAENYYWRLDSRIKVVEVINNLVDQGWCRKNFMIIYGDLYEAVSVTETTLKKVE